VPPVPPVARFSASPVAGKVPLTTVFTDRSTGSPATWQWTFGDGQASDQQSPVHVYNRPGIYIARLKVSNSAGSDTAWSLVLVLPSWIPWFS
jgi:PKD repeat protein